MSIKKGYNNSRLIFVLTCSFASLAFSSSFGVARDSPILPGGPKGFEVECSRGQAIVGFNLRSGKDLDQITPLCAEVRADGSTGQAVEVGHFGGGGGSPQQTLCPAGTAVDSFVVAASHVGTVNHIEVSCSDIRTLRPEKASPYPFGGEYINNTVSTGCTGNDIFLDGEIATGLIGSAGGLVTGLGLRCSTVKSIQPALIRPFNPNATVMLESKNFPGMFIRHFLLKGYLNQLHTDLDRRDASFFIRKGLTGNNISFESSNFPGMFLRHKNFRVLLENNDGSAQFANDATFIQQETYIPAYKKFASVNIPNFYIRHRNFEIYLEKRDESYLFISDSAFYIRQDP